MGLALLMLAASGLAVIYKVHAEFLQRTEQAAQASARAQAAQGTAQRLLRMGLDLRSLLAAGGQPETLMARHRDSLHWQQTKLEAALRELGKTVTADEAPAVEKAQASSGALAGLYTAALAGTRQPGAMALEPALLAAEAEAQRRMDELQGVLGRATRVGQGRLQDSGGQAAQVAVVALLGGVLSLALALFFGWWTAHHVERAKLALQRQQQEADNASAGLLVEMQTHLADSQQALKVSLQAAKELSDHAERLVAHAGLVPEPLAAQGAPATPFAPSAPFTASLTTLLSPQALSAQVIERARRASR